MGKNYFSLLSFYFFLLSPSTRQLFRSKTVHPPGLYLSSKEDCTQAIFIFKLLAVLFTERTSSLIYPNYRTGRSILENPA